MTNKNLKCRFCGMSVKDNVYAHKTGLYCCEICFLKENEFNAFKTERDNAYLALVEALALALDIREHETGLHSKRVACHTLVLARSFTDDKKKLRQIYWGSLLHDIGKIGISDAVLLKEGPLTDTDWEEMRKHPQLGHSILSSVAFMDEAASIVLSHEEHFDGSGYPNKLAGSAIPWGARIFMVIDALDAMTSDRPYREGISFDLAKDEIIDLTGVHFDPGAVGAFIKEEQTLRKMVAMKCGMPSLDDIFPQ